MLGGLHPYRYAHNGPTWDADPLGLWPSLGTIVAAVAAVAVGAAIIAFAPIALPLAILVAGAAAGAVGFGLNEAFNEEHFCLACVLKAAAKGAVVGAAAAVSFALFPAAAGVTALAGLGAVSGAISYGVNHALTPGHQWDWGEFTESCLLGGAFGALGGAIGGSGGAPGLKLSSPMPALATAGGPALAAEAVTVIPAVSAAQAAALGAGVAVAGGPTAAMMASSGGGGGGSGSDEPPGEGEQAANEPSEPPNTPQSVVRAEGRHGDLSGNLEPGVQSHHLNQDAAFKPTIPRADGQAIGIEGNAFTEPGTPHYEAHRSMEDFWNQYRKGGPLEDQIPTNGDYSRALVNRPGISGGSTL